MRLPAFIRRRLTCWAKRLIASREPDRIIGDPANPIWYRWFVIPFNRRLNIYVHDWKSSDDDRALHDHPGPNLSIMLDGSFLEWTIADGGVHHCRRIEAGDLRFRWGTSAHRIELIEGQRAVTLFFMGPYHRIWGFHCRKGWRPHHEYAARVGKASVISAGCGEWE